MEIPIRMDDLGVPLFSETSICVVKVRLYMGIGNDYVDGEGG